MEELMGPDGFGIGQGSRRPDCENARLVQIEGSGETNKLLRDIGTVELIRIHA